MDQNAALDAITRILKTIGVQAAIVVFQTTVLLHLYLYVCVGFDVLTETAEQTPRVPT